MIIATDNRELAERLGGILKSATPKFGCLMAMLPSLESELPNWAADNIPSDTLAEDGVETETHCTVLYGFGLSFNPERLRGLLDGFGPVRMTLGKFSRFECEEYDVLKFSVVSPQLVKIHQSIAKEFSSDITPSKWSYKPHVTVAYIKKGSNESLDASQFEGRSFTVNQFLYSLPEKKGRAELTLSAKPSPRVSATSLSLRIANLLRASSPSKTSEAHDKVRNAAASQYQGAVNEFVAHAKAEALKKKRRQDTEEAVAVFLMLMIDAQEEGYWNTYTALEKVEPPLEHITGSELHPEAKEFAESRQEFLEQFPADAYDQLVEVAETARADGLEESDVRKAVTVAAESIRKGRGKVLAETEAQVTYGSSELRILQRAGFKTVLWQTEDDEKVRPSHMDNEEQGPVEIGRPFSNGCRYPGDPKAPIGETINCRCHLVGYEKRN